MNQMFESYLLKLRNTAVKEQTKHTSRAALEGKCGLNNHAIVVDSSSSWSAAKLGSTTRKSIAD
jgi:hypothetical protein